MLGQRIIALVIMLIPALIGMYGWNLMKNSFYAYMGAKDFPWLSFLFGLILFLAGVSFIAGFIFHRDGKRKLLQPRFMKKNKRLKNNI